MAAARGPFNQSFVGVFMHLPFSGASWRSPVDPPLHLLTLRSWLIGLSLLFACCASVLAHAVTEGDKGYIQEISGVNLLPFVYLGAKHMVTGYDHILFLFGVIFFLYRLSHIGLYVSLFALGHSTTSCWGCISTSASTATSSTRSSACRWFYKALDNLGAFQRVLGFQPNTKAATLVFGLFHGFGLASKIIDYNISPDGLVPNLLAFNVGVEIGQLLALSVILIGMGYWRRTAGFLRQAYTATS
jgi:hypothetical protein